MNQFAYLNWLFAMVLLGSGCTVTQLTPTPHGTIIATERQEASPTPTATASSTATITPTATNTAVPTHTATPTETAIPTVTPTGTPTVEPSPTATPIPSNTPVPTATAVSCQRDPGNRWGPTLYNEFRERLVCATTGEIRTGGAYQTYTGGLMVWRQDVDLVYVLFNNGRYAIRNAKQAPDGFFVSDRQKGAFGYWWQEDTDIRNVIGEPTQIEFNTTNFAAQDFSGGTIFYFLENQARNYVLFKDNGSWLSRQE